ncbi:hypothetical protein [Nitrospira sp. M1]
MDESHLATVEHTAGVSSLSYHIRDWRDFEAVSLDADEAFTRSIGSFRRSEGKFGPDPATTQLPTPDFLPPIYRM